jgi:hypothetical protein
MIFSFGAHKTAGVTDALSKKTRFLYNHATKKPNITTWIIPYTEPTKESSPTGRCLDLGSKTMERSFDGYFHN